MQNWQKWLATLGLGFLGGCVTCAMEPGSPPIGEYIRHGLIGLGPAIACLNMSLTKTNGSATPQK